MRVCSSECGVTSGPPTPRRHLYTQDSRREQAISHPLCFFLSLSLAYTSITFWRQDVKPASGLVTRITYPNEGLDLGNYHRRLRFITIGIRVPVGGQIRRKKLTLERGTLQVTLAAVVPSSEAVTRLRVNVNFFLKKRCNTRVFCCLDSLHFKSVELVHLINPFVWISSLLI